MDPHTLVVAAILLSTPCDGELFAIVILFLQTLRGKHLLIICICLLIV